MNTPFIGFVILNYNSEKEAVALGRSLASYSIVDAIQFVDNSSPDSHNLIDQFCDGSRRQARLLALPKNSGYARGNNAGAFELITWSNCSIIAIANPDIEISEEALISCANYLLEHTECGAIAPIMVRSVDKRPTYPWKLPSKFTLLCRAAPLIGGLVSKKDRYPIESFLTGGYCYVDVLPGSLLLIDRNSFITIGGFDESTFLYGEEKLLSAKLLAAGKRVVVDTSHTYTHIVGESIHKNIPSLIKRFDYMRDGNLIFAKKVLGASKAYCIAYRVLSFVSTRATAIACAVKHKC